MQTHEIPSPVLTSGESYFTSRTTMSLDLESASKFEVIDETGKKVAFGTLFADQKTVVVFIRMFYATKSTMYKTDAF